MLDLCNKYRPKTLADVYGQENAVSFFKSAVKKPAEAPRYYLFSGSSGTGKCVAGDSWIQTSEGLRRIRSLVPSSEQEGFVPLRNLELHTCSQGHTFSPDRGYYSGHKKCVRLWFKGSVPLTCTLVHPLLKYTVSDEGEWSSRWTPASLLAPGDRVAVDRSGIRVYPTSACLSDTLKAVWDYRGRRSLTEPLETLPLMLDQLDGAQWGEQAVFLKAVLSALSEKSGDPNQVRYAVQSPSLPYLEALGSIAASFGYYVDMCSFMGEYILAVDTSRLSSESDSVPSPRRCAEITAVEYLDAECFDLSVPDVHYFTANGVLCHNTSISRCVAHDIIGDGFMSSPRYVEIDSSEKAIADDFDRMKDYIFSDVDGFKVVLIDECHLLPPQTSQKLLKVFEDFTGDVFVILATTDPQLVPPALISRLLRFDFQTPTVEQVEQYVRTCLAKEAEAGNPIQLSDRCLKLIALNANGNYRASLKNTEVALFEGEEQYSSSYASVFKMLRSYFFDFQQADADVVHSMYGYVYEQLKILFNSYFRDEVLNPASPSYNTVYKAQVLPKLFGAYLKYMAYVKSSDTFFSFLLVFRQVLRAVAQAGQPAQGGR